MAVVQAWRQMDAAPLKSSLGKAISEVHTFRDTAGTDLYHVVYLSPAGFAIVPADDLVEPIIAFSSEGAYDASEANPLGALVGNDLPGRIARVRSSAQATTEKSAELSPSQAAALRKWERLQTSEPVMEYGLAAVSDVRVAPLIQSKWSQTTVSGNYCYNYYTPNNYPSGCVATAMSQLLRFYQMPTTTVGTESFTITVDDVDRSEALMGGNGTGGAYNWSNMPLVPDGATTDTQRQAIGRLLHDAGATVNMSYTSGGSGADTLETATALRTTFGYSNAVKGYYNGGNIPADARNTMVNPNLDAGLPVLFGITGSSGGHAIVGDGYGYQSGTMYHHLNMGWSGSNDLWYNLPTIDDSYYGFTSVYKVIYNVYTSGSGEIISGRVGDCAGAAVSGVTVTASLNGSPVASATTNSNGIYAFPRLSSARSYTITATKSGLSFAPQTAATGTSSDYSSAPGNKWGIDFSNTQGCSYSTLTVTKAGAGSGTVSSSPAGISCGAVCSAPFVSPSTVTLTATADSGSGFTGWSGGGCSGTGACVMNFSGTTTVTATFEPTTAVLSETFDGVMPPVLPSGWQSSEVTADGAWETNIGTLHPSGIAAHSGANLAYFNSYTASSGDTAALVSPSFALTGMNNATASFWMYRDTGYSAFIDRVEIYVNTSSTLAGATLLGTVHRSTALTPAVAAAGWYKYEFSIPYTFSGAVNYLIVKGLSDYGNDIHVDDVSVAGVFSGTHNLTVSLAGTGGGSVTSDPAGISCPASSCSASFPSGSTVSLLQVPDAFSTFGSWSGDCSGTGDCSVTMDTARTVIANFVLAPKAMIGTIGYPSLNLAYAAAVSGATIRTLDADLEEVLNMAAGTSIILEGGYKADFSGKSGTPTILKGPLTVGTGSLTVEGITIK
jgi:hypothetical protein